MTRRANHRHIFSIAGIEPAPGTGRGLFEFGRESGNRCRTTPLCCRIFAVRWPCAGLKEIAMKKLARGRTDCRFIFLVRGKSTRTCRKCRAGRGVGRRRAGTGRRGGRCVHRIYRRAVDRALVGNAATLIAIPRKACSTIRPRTSATGGRRGNSPPPVRTSPLPAKRAAPPPVQGFE